MQLVLGARLDDAVPGQFGEVYTGKYMRKFDVAVKKLHMKWNQTSEEIVLDFQEECQFMRKNRHANIVYFFGSGKFSDTCPFLVTELMSRGSLQSILYERQKHALSWRRKFSFALGKPSSLFGF